MSSARGTLLLVAVALCALTSAKDLGCLSPTGKAVDWFVALKVPTGVDDQGLAYNYADSTTSGKFNYYTNINDASLSPIGQTLGQIPDKKSNNYAAVYWNDQTPDEGEHQSYAHAKGIAASSSKQGFIIVHSVPKFPTFTMKNLKATIPNSGQVYGQHFLCVTVSIQDLNKYALALQVDHVYPMSESHIPATLVPSLMNLQGVIDKEYPDGKDMLQVTFHSIGGETFTKFAKSPRLEEPVYSVSVAPYYDLPFTFETWGNGPGGLLAPQCVEDPHVFSNLVVTMPNADVSFKYTTDHSKYGVSVGGSVSCFGDINRQESQNWRGGGTVCFEVSALHASVSAFFTSQQQCTGEDAHHEDHHAHAHKDGYKTQSEIFRHRFFEQLYWKTIERIAQITEESPILEIFN